MRKYPFVKQKDYKDCAVASISMILKYYGGYVQTETLRDMTKTTKKGTTAYHIKEAFINMGFESYGIRCELNSINTDIVLPCIANVIIDNSYKHFVVIYEINKNKEYLLIADPQDKIKKISYLEFSKIFNNVLIIMYPIRNVPNEDRLSYTDFINKTIFRNKKMLIKIFILSLFITIFSVAMSFYMQVMINSIAYKDKFLLIIFIVFLLLQIFKIVLEYIRNNVLIHLTEKIDLCLTLDTFNSILSLPYRYFRSRTTGEVLSRINDLDVIRDTISKVALSLFMDLPLTLISFIFLYIINNTLFFIGLIILLFYSIVIVIFNKYFDYTIKDIQHTKSLTTSYMVESISGIETVKGLHIEEFIKSNFRNKYVNLLNKVFKYQNVYFIQNTIKELIDKIGFMIIILIGCIYVAYDKIQLASLITFSFLLSYFLEPIKSILELTNDIKESKSALDRVLELNMNKSDNKLFNLPYRGNILINNLSYTFDDKKYVLKNVNLDIKESENVVLLGESGSGKSTLLKILMKYYKIDNNRVFINSVDLNNYSENDKVIYISQQEILFNDTIYNNLMIDSSDNNLLFKVSDICLLKDILDKSLGYNTLIEENGFNFSGGERQRLILARALIKGFDVLIIDEGLSQVDVSMERKILKNIFNCYRDKTIIVASHRVDNCDLFDRIIQLDNGKVKVNEIRNKEVNSMI